MTKVVFRKFKDGQIIALFPDIIADRLGNIVSYMHIGQHSSASKDIVDITKLASYEEYAPLLKELKRMGYKNLKVCKRLI